MAKEVLEMEVKSNLGEVSKDASSAASEFKVMGVSLNGVKAGFASAAVTAKGMFGSIKAGLISTGIGAFVVLIGSLISYFTNTKKGAEMLERAMAGLGAIVSVVTDLFSSVGETMVSAFEDPKQAIADLWEFIKTNLMNRLTGMVDGFKAAGKLIQAAISLDWEGVKEGAEEYGQALIQVGTGMDVEQQKAFIKGIKDIGTEMNNEAAAAMRLKGMLQQLKDEEREFSKVRAQTRQDIQKARLDALDESKTAEERLAALQRANDLELKTTEDSLEMQRRKIEVQKETMALSENMAEDLDDLAALEVELIDLQTQSFQTRKRLATEMETLTNEIAASEKTRKKEKQDEIDKQDKIDEDTLLKKEARAKTEAEILLALQQGNSLALIEDLQERALAELKIQEDKEIASAELLENAEAVKEAIRIKYARLKGDVIKKEGKDEAKWSEMSSKEQLGIASSTAGSMAKILGEESAAGKAFAITQATIDTFQGANAAYSSMAKIPYVGPVLGGIAAAAAIASGIANVKAIASAGGGGGGGSAPSTPSAPSGQPAPQMMSGAFDISGGVAPEATKAYVVTDEMSNSQNQLANIRRRATI